MLSFTVLIFLFRGVIDLVATVMSTAIIHLCLLVGAQSATAFASDVFLLDTVSLLIVALK